MQISRYVNGEKVRRIRALSVRNEAVRRTVEAVNRRLSQESEEKV